jgi:hypothetical protein
MRRREFISCVIAACFAVIILADPTHAQTPKQPADEGTLAAKIKCKDFQKTSEGKWISSAGTMIPDHTNDDDDQHGREWNRCCALADNGSAIGYWWRSLSKPATATTN